MLLCREAQEGSGVVSDPRALQDAKHTGDSHLVPEPAPAEVPALHPQGHLPQLLPEDEQVRSVVHGPGRHPLGSVTELVEAVVDVTDQLPADGELRVDIGREEVLEGKGDVSPRHRKGLAPRPTTSHTPRHVSLWAPSPGASTHSGDAHTVSTLLLGRPSAAPCHSPEAAGVGPAPGVLHLLRGASAATNPTGREEIRPPVLPMLCVWRGVSVSLSVCVSVCVSLSVCVCVQVQAAASSPSLECTFTKRKAGHSPRHTTR